MSRLLIPGGGGGGGGGGDFTLISKVTADGVITTITFNEDFTPFTHLHLEGKLATPAATAGEGFYCYFNGDHTNTHYETSYMGIGAGGTPANVSYPLFSVVPGTTAPAHAAAGITASFRNINGTTFLKDFIATSGGWNNTPFGDTFGYVFCGAWNSNAAITKIELVLTGGEAPVADSVFSLYGLK